MLDTLNKIAMYIGYGCMISTAILLLFSFLYGRGLEKREEQKRKSFYNGHKNYNHLNK